MEFSTRNTPDVLAAVRDLIRGALKLAGYVNTSAGRRAHTERQRVLVACLQREVCARDSHGGQGRVRAAHFPAMKTIEELSDATTYRS